MSRILGLVCFVCCLAISGAAVSSEPLKIDLASESVSITSGFTGADVALYGVKHGRGDVVVVLEGPRRDVVVRQKSSFLGAWINRSSVRFEDVPLYYDYAVSDAGALKLMSPDMKMKHRMGVEYLPLRPDNDGLEDSAVKSYRDAFVRDRRGRLFYPETVGRIEFVDDSFFKLRMHVPANVPKGVYDVKAFLLRDGRIKGQAETQLKVGQVGFNSNVYRFSQKYGFIYALLCVFVAGFFGWMSNKLVRKN